MDRSRRTLLAALGGATTALAGCSFLSGDTDRRDATETLSPAPVTPTESEAPAIAPVPEDVPHTSIVESAATDRTYAFTETTTYVPDGGHVRAVFSSPPDADGPATVRATLRNETDESRTFRLEEMPVVSGGDAFLGNDARLLLVPTEPNEFVDTVAPVERTDAGLWVLDSATEEFVAGSVELAPGEAATGEYALVGGPTQRRPLTVGRYVFGSIRAPFAERALAPPRTHSVPFGVTVWETDDPGPQDLSTYTGEPTPSLPDLERTVWYHATDEGAFLEPLTERVRTPQRTVFTLKNHTRETFEGYPTWRLYKRVDGEWYRLWLGERNGFASSSGLAPGDYAVGVVGFHHADVIPSRDRDVTEPFVGSGHYAAVVAPVDGTFPTGYASRFRVFGPDVVLSPTDGVSTRVDDGTLEVQSPEAVPGEEVRVTLERAPDATPERRLLPEQVMRLRGVRNTLSPLRGVESADRAVLQTGEYVARPTGAALGLASSDDTVAFVFEGTTYRLATPDVTPERTPTPVE